MNEKLIVIGIFSTMLWYVLFYILSVGPARLEKKIGSKSYKICSILRKIAFAGLFLHIAAEIMYFIKPIDIGLPKRIIPGVTGWVYSIIIGILITLWASWIIKLVSKVATDSFTPDKNNQMFGGLYEKIRHPQAVADVAYFFGIAFLLNSLFLLIIAAIWILMNYLIVIAEESDLKIRFGQSYSDYMDRTNRFVPEYLNLHGLISFILFFIAIGIGGNQLLIYSKVLSVIYFTLVIAFILYASISFCSHCQSREKCAHFIFGFISVKLTKYKDTGYSKIQYFIFGFLSSIIIVIPQYFLLKNTKLLLAFWFLIVLCIIEIFTCVCVRCKNKWCPMCKKKGKCND